MDNGKIRGLCSICRINRCINYRKANKYIGIESSRSRRAKEKSVNERYTEEDQKITFEIFGKQCFRCESDDDITIDHHYCLNKGNALTIENAVPLCRSCNSRKKCKDPKDFYTNEELQEINLLFKKAVIFKNNKC